MQDRLNALSNVLRHIHQHSQQMMIAIYQNGEPQVVSANFVVLNHCYYAALPMKYARAWQNAPQVAVLLLETPAFNPQYSQLSWVAMARIVARSENRYPYLRVALQEQFNSACFVCELRPQQGRVVCASGQTHDIDAQDLWSIAQQEMAA
ncbi:MAG: hypothetical protein IKH45_01760 [Neisseriaceae bacterium]|nr:hypothetical protein [Neisseriaceae bacterium]MBR3481600.1 hypothetical protein [Neisseriaceae bacterium]